MIARRLLRSLWGAYRWFLDVGAGWVAITYCVGVLVFGAFMLGLSFVVPGCPWPVRLLFVATMALGGYAAAMCHKEVRR